MIREGMGREGKEMKGREGDEGKEMKGREGKGVE
jgi:hypothetical protein